MVADHDPVDECDQDLQPAQVAPEELTQPALAALYESPRDRRPGGRHLLER